MGFIVEIEQGMDIEVRRESIKLIPDERHPFHCHDNKVYGWYVEIEKAYLRRLVEFFNAEPRRLQEGAATDSSGTETPEPTRGPYRYDGKLYIFGPSGEMIAEVRGAGGDLPMDANGHVLGASRDMLDVLESLADLIEPCAACGGTGQERHDPESACGCCGGQGEVLDATGMITDIREAIAKARGE